MESLKNRVGESIGELLRRARAARDASALDEGRDLAERAWDLSSKGGTEDERCEAGHLLCLFHYRLGSLDTLIDLGEQVVGILAAPERRSIKADLLRWMALAGCETGRFEIALHSANEACTTAQELGDQRQLALSLTALGACFERMGDPWQAERLMDDAL